MPAENENASLAQRLDKLIAQGQGLIEARRNPARGRKKFPDFGQAYDSWNTAGKTLVAKLSGPDEARRWTAGWCRAMHAMDQDAAQCLKEHERQQAMLAELRRDLPSNPPASAPATKTDARDLRKELLLKDLRRVARLLKKKTVTVKEYRLKGRSTESIVIGRFHGWNNALAAAGLEVPARYNVPTLELFENLDRVWKARGRRPTQDAMVKPLSEFSRIVYTRRFGTWKRAMRAFVTWKRTGKLPKEISEPWKAPRGAQNRLWYLVLKRDGYKCTACGRSPSTHPGTVLHLDHIKPRARGGLTTLENLATLCQKCNLGKGAL